MRVPVHLPLAESVDKEREHKDLWLFEGEKKNQGKGREALTVHTLLGTIFFPFVFILYLRVHQRLNAQRALSHRTTAAKEKKRESERERERKAHLF